MAPAPKAQPPAGAVAPQQNQQTSSLAMPEMQNLVTQPVHHSQDADDVWLEPMSLEYGVGLLPLAGALVVACSEMRARKKSRGLTADESN